MSGQDILRVVWHFCSLEGFGGSPSEEKRKLHDEDLGPFDEAATLGWTGVRCRAVQ